MIGKRQCPPTHQKATVMASERTHKIDGAVRKLRAVMDAFNMKGTNRATMLNAINTIETLRTRPAPAATDAGLETIGYGYMNSLGELEYAHATSSEMRTEALCRRSQAEEQLAAERARAEGQWAGWVKEIAERKADNAAKDAQITEYEAGLVQMHREMSALEVKLTAAEKALEPFAKAALGYDDPDENGPWPDIQDVFVTLGDCRRARAVLGGKL